jgi:hypothetical protein
VRTVLPTCYHRPFLPANRLPITQSIAIDLNPSCGPALSNPANEYRTNDADLPAGERYRPWDAPRVREWAERIGPSAVVVVNRIFESVPVDEQGLAAALAVLRLSRRYSAERVEAACRLALTGPVRPPKYAHLQPVLATGQDQAAGLRPSWEEAVEHGGYVRGTGYYAGGTK